MAWRFTGRFVLLALLLSAAFSAAAPSFAQSGPEARPAPDWVTPPNDLPRQDRGQRTPSLDTLFDALKIAPDAESAKAIETRIWAVWMISGSDTCNLLMGRAKAAADEKDYDLAIKLLDAVVEIKPGYVEGWNRRDLATLHWGVMPHLPLRLPRRVMRRRSLTLRHRCLRVSRARPQQEKPALLDGCGFWTWWR